MPVFLDQQITPVTRLLAWKITEPFDDLFDEVALTDINMVRMMSMKSEQHQRGFLAVRKLLNHIGYSDFDLVYHATGKPGLRDGRKISISHSHEFSSIIVSDIATGIDLELMRDKILRISHKFTSETEESWLNPQSPDYIAQLTAIWGVKESIFKIRNEIGISFKDHISVPAFDLSHASAKAVLDFENHSSEFVFRFQTVEDYMLVYAFESADEQYL